MVSMTTGKKRNITRFLARTGEKKGRGQEGSPASSAMSAELPFAFKIVFSSHTIQDHVAPYNRRHDANNDNDDEDSD